MVTHLIYLITFLDARHVEMIIILEIVTFFQINWQSAATAKVHIQLAIQAVKSTKKQNQLNLFLPLNVFHMLLL